MKINDSQLYIYIKKNQSLLLEAQELCKKGIFQIRLLMEELIQKLHEEKMITDHSISIIPFNIGYAYTIEISFGRIHWNDIEYPIFGFISTSQYRGSSPCDTSIWIHPDYFYDFDSDTQGLTKLEALLFEDYDDHNNVYPQNKNEKLIDFPIKNRKQITEAVNSFVYQNHNIIKKLLKMF